MPFGAQVLTNNGMTDIADIIGLKLLDIRFRTLTASSGNSGSFTVPLGSVTSFNNSGFVVFSLAARDVDMIPSLRSLASLQTYVDYPSTITSSSVATVNYRGGGTGEYRFWTWITEIGN